MFFFASKKSRKQHQRNQTDVLQGLNGVLDGRLDMLQGPTHNIYMFTNYVVVSTLVDFHYKNRGKISELKSMFCQIWVGSTNA